MEFCLDAWWVGFAMMVAGVTVAIVEIACLMRCLSASWLEVLQGLAGILCLLAAIVIVGGLVIGGINLMGAAAKAEKQAVEKCCEPKGTD